MSSSALPPDQSGPISERDKILLQDKLAERIKLRESIDQMTNYAGIGIAGVVAWIVGQVYSNPPSLQAELASLQRMEGALLISFFLVVGFSIKLEYLVRELKAKSNAINALLTGWNVDDKLQVRWGGSLTLLSVPIGIVMLVSLAGAGIRERNLKIRIETTKPSNRPQPSPAAPAPPASHQAAQ
jgi:hypothetical protein